MSRVALSRLPGERVLAVDFPLNASIVKSYADAGKPDGSVRAPSG